MKRDHIRFFAKIAPQVQRNHRVRQTREQYDAALGNALQPFDALVQQHQAPIEQAVLALAKNMIEWAAINHVQKSGDLDKNWDDFGIVCEYANEAFVKKVTRTLKSSLEELRTELPEKLVQPLPPQRRIQHFNLDQDDFIENEVESTQNTMRQPRANGKIRR